MHTSKKLQILQDLLWNEKTILRLLNKDAVGYETEHKIVQENIDALQFAVHLVSKAVDDEVHSELTAFRESKFANRAQSSYDYADVIETPDF